MTTDAVRDDEKFGRYLSPLSAWALSFGIAACVAALAHLPVHVITADVELQGNYAEKGFDSIILKPVTVGTLGPLLAGLS